MSELLPEQEVQRREVGLTCLGDSLLRKAQFPRLTIPCKIKYIDTDVCRVHLCGGEISLWRKHHIVSNWLRLVQEDIAKRKINVTIVCDLEERCLRGIAQTGREVPLGFRQTLDRERQEDEKQAIDEPPETVKTFNCLVCSGDIPVDDLFIASDCNHQLCRDCASEYIKSEVDEMRIPVRCWMHVSDCKFEIDITSIELVVDDQTLMKYYENSVTRVLSGDANARIIECINDDCKYRVSMNAEDQLNPSVQCEKCGVVFCPACRVRYHSNMSCAEFKRSQEHRCPRVGCDGVVKGAEEKCVCPRCRDSWCWECGVQPYHEKRTCEDIMSQHCKRCPGCRVRTQKTKGCNHMQCKQCKTHWCYLCVKALDSKNPLQHYGEERGTCFAKCFTEADVVEE
eukprot:TRINITY_DN2340_c0_g1_i3.p1 TRINITY_DN2340_c0_g1~~TRINITY_DN2340_c0_g1_i3.p1  ORF type:complete len:439 (-),score=54.40 TRINITY_DN2340_c0_g1_i3:69-1259(-)